MIRALVLSVGTAAVGLLLAWLWSDDGTGGAIGAGLVAFGAVVLASGIWAGVDGVRRRRPVPRLFLGWLVAAVAVGLVYAVLPQVRSGGFDTGVLVDDLLALGPFGAGLVIGPACLGLGAGLLIRAGRGQPVASTR